MRFQELREYYEASDDNLNIAKLDHTRRAKLTLSHLNKLRKKRSLEKVENEQRKQDLSAIYGKAPE